MPELTPNYSIPIPSDPTSQLDERRAWLAVDAALFGAIEPPVDLSVHYPVSTTAMEPMIRFITPTGTRGGVVHTPFELYQRTTEFGGDNVTDSVGIGFSGVDGSQGIGNWGIVMEDAFGNPGVEPVNFELHILGTPSDDSGQKRPWTWTIDRETGAAIVVTTGDSHFAAGIFGHAVDTTNQIDFTTTEILLTGRTGPIRLFGDSVIFQTLNSEGAPAKGIAIVPFPTDDTLSELMFGSPGGERVGLATSGVDTLKVWNATGSASGFLVAASLTDTGLQLDNANLILAGTAPRIHIGASTTKITIGPTLSADGATIQNDANFKLNTKSGDIQYGNDSRAGLFHRFGLTQQLLIDNDTGNFSTLGTLTAGTGPTTLTNAAGKLLPAAINGYPTDGTKYLDGNGTWTVPAGGGGGDALVANPLSQFAATTSAQLAGVISDETGTGALVFATSPGFTTAANPISNDGATLGTAALQWSDLFLAEGGVINWDNGDATLTQTGNSLALAGADLSLAAVLNFSASGAGTPPGLLTLDAGANTSVLGFYPQSATNVSMSLQIIPRGTGTAGNLSQFLLFGQDRFADASNLDFCGFRATGTAYTLGSANFGSATLKPIILSAGVFAGTPINTTQLVLTITGNIGIGVSAHGTSAAKVLGIGNGTEPSTSPADMIQIYSVDLSAGNATLGLRTETAVTVAAAGASDEYLSIRINGATKKLLLHS